VTLLLVVLQLGLSAALAVQLRQATRVAHPGADLHRGIASARIQHPLVIRE
jgi:hypothetical protein